MHRGQPPGVSHGATRGTVPAVTADITSDITSDATRYAIHDVGDKAGSGPPHAAPRGA